MAGKGAEERERAFAALAALDLSAIVDPGLRQGFGLLLNLVEELRRENLELRAENQRLRDEVARLKGEQGKPDIRPPAPKPPAGDYSSERERREPKGWAKGGKVAQVRVDREQVLEVDPAVLPPDAAFKGYEDVVVQDVVLRTDNVRFRKEVFYSASARRRYLAPLPAGYAGQFGPGLKALVLVLYFGGQMSEPKIAELLGDVGVRISAGEVSNLLVKGRDSFHAEAAAVRAAGLASGPWQHLDDTLTRVNGQDRHCQVLCNPLYTAYETTAAKDRLAVLDVLRNGRPRSFRWDARAEAYLERVGLSARVRSRLAGLPRDRPLDEPALTAWLEEHVPELGPQQRKWVLDALAVAAYRAETAAPMVRLLVCDDAPQFEGVTEARALCWVHEGRHYRKLLPYLPGHRQALDDFLGRFWDYYRELLAYRERPSAAERARLDAAFDALFATETGYWALDDRIALTRAKKRQLLAVLDHPEVPLHNNPAELGARRRVRKRDVSFGPRSEDGKRAWDTFQTLAATAQKLGVSFYAYVQDRVSQAYQLPGLADLISARAHDLNLGASWSPP
jgi:cell division protein FtsB